MPAVPTPAAQRLVLAGVSWRAYTRLLRVFDDRHLRITYDRGALEIMTLSPPHERVKHLLGLFVVALVEELGWDWAGFGSMTFRRRRRRRGLEPDECFWIASEPLVRGKEQIDLRVDPPPDLVLEIEITHSALDRMAIYAALAVPEVWRCDGQTIVVELLGADGRYTAGTTSRAFPFLDLAEVARFLALRAARSNAVLLREFRAWVRQRIAAAWAPPPP
jgi:Uma2 family endonuclease